MIRKLQTKFICIIMSVVMVLLALLLVIVVRFTKASLEIQSSQMLQTIANNTLEPGRPAERQEDVMLPFFTVQITPRGDIITYNAGYFDLSDEAELLAIVEAAHSSDSHTGLLEEYDLRFYRTSSPVRQTFVFADIASEQATLRNLTYTCILIWCLGFVVFLIISIFLSRWVVAPVDKAWNQQRQFVADASHELKTPLTVIMTNAELLQTAGSPEDLQRSAASILTMSRQMRALVEGLLDLARVDNGAVKTSFAPLDLSHLISEDLLNFDPLFFERGLTLSSSIDPGLHIKGSAAHLLQVLDILLDNALKYAAPSSTVEVRLYRHGSHCLLSVASCGDPISPEDLKNIFKRFYRIDKARSRDGSFGLGLSIAQSIVSDHGGRIWAESASGVNTFCVQLPSQ